VAHGAGFCSSHQGLGVLQRGGRWISPDFRLWKLPELELMMRTSPGGVCVIFLCTGEFPAKSQGYTVYQCNTIFLFVKKINKFMSIIKKYSDDEQTIFHGRTSFQ